MYSSGVYYFSCIEKKSFKHVLFGIIIDDTRVKNNLIDNLPYRKIL